MKRIITLAIVMCMAFAAVTGCAQKNGAGNQNNTTEANSTVKGGETSGTENQKPKELTVWVDKLFYDKSNEMLKNRIEEYGSSNGIKINVEMIANQDMQTKWAAAVESKNYPDVTTIGSQDLGNFIDKGLMKDLSPLFAKIEEKNGKIFQSLKDVNTVDGKIYGIPRSANGHTMLYRTDLLEKAGYKEPPKTWEEFAAMAKKITDQGNGVYGAGIGYGMKDSDAEWFTRYVLASYGASINSEDGKSADLNTPEAIEAIQLLADIVTESAPPSATNWDDTGNNKAYLAGQVAFAFNAASLYLSAKENPEIKDVTAIAPVPAGPAGRYIIGSCMDYAIFEGSKNHDYAEQVIEYIMEKDWYEQWSESCAPLQGPVYEQLADASVWKDIPDNKTIMETIKSCRFLGYPGPSNAEAGIIYNKRYINEMFQRILIEKVPVETAVKEMNDKINKEVYNK